MDNNYQLSRIHNYVTGLMSEKEMYDLERDALDDPFLQDALDGYKLQQGVDSQPLSILQQRLARRVADQSGHKSHRFYSWQRLAIGTAAGVLFLVACSLIFFNHLYQPNSVTNHQVILMEEELRVQTAVMDGTDAAPVQGWEQFNEELNSELRDWNYAGDLRIEFQVIRGRASGLKIDATADSELIAVLRSFIEEKVRWQGTQGELRIQIDSQ